MTLSLCDESSTKNTQVSFSSGTVFRFAISTQFMSPMRGILRPIIPYLTLGFLLLSHQSIFTSAVPVRLLQQSSMPNSNNSNSNCGVCPTDAVFKCNSVSPTQLNMVRSNLISRCAQSFSSQQPITPSSQCCQLHESSLWPIYAACACAGDASIPGLSAFVQGPQVVAVCGCPGTTRANTNTASNAGTIRDNNTNTGINTSLESNLVPINSLNTSVAPSPNVIPTFTTNNGNNQTAIDISTVYSAVSFANGGNNTKTTIQQPTAQQPSNTMDSTADSGTSTSTATSGGRAGG